MEDVEDLKSSAQILQRLHQAKDLEEQVLLLQRLASFESLDYATDFVHPDGRKATVRELIHEDYDKASTYSRTTRHAHSRTRTRMITQRIILSTADLNKWSVVRRAASLLERIVFGLMGCVTEILVQGKEITIGRSVSEETVIREPLAPGVRTPPSFSFINQLLLLLIIKQYNNK